MLCELPHAAVPGIKCYSSVELTLQFQATAPLPGKRHFSESPSKHIPRNPAFKWRERKKSHFPRRCPNKPQTTKTTTKNIIEEVRISDSKENRSSLWLFSHNRMGTTSLLAGVSMPRDPGGFHEEVGWSIYGYQISTFHKDFFLPPKHLKCISHLPRYAEETRVKLSVRALNPRPMGEDSQVPQVVGAISKELCMRSNPAEAGQLLSWLE